MYITCYIHALFKITINLAEYFVICNFKLKLLFSLCVFNINFFIRSSIKAQKPEKNRELHMCSKGQLFWILWVD